MRKKMWTFLSKEIQIIRSPKHKGALFLKVKGSKKNFICKIYPAPNKSEQMDIANLIIVSNKLLDVSKKALDILEEERLSGDSGSYEKQPIEYELEEAIHEAEKDEGDKK